ncbi:hypothetical protein A3A71_03020 [Candidatus Berkelbacteria bacterium RIFCSPLOWO2_01_FULL_50_28]|uniref:Uncharacterized protein n=1 Tax=Candidatus Berkelbacteria bacterium RIFCSPLOWO2_01_FULL_50_28 TaxID=1797471 RepID=A0A1F5EC99_9BACT|nr:MAG: hypothetical protein A2807_02585 [Candidatus Berkelbacteria bacterium RIFCSPHIGHO2_01_FULL_50_36]OGD63256.1 MAG: hypothetical protein A3F39_01685 [Candidatus Berkelbacteria bacterium RIFCSPHIGHO2_12_FULL_50_11]OGD65038.1 MAG: hypothetical protein A3A71_03020 [Candidatus Berkelbacteria bacterium RIFCSPLOWO2_01_FULL_50_28]
MIVKPYWLGSVFPNGAWKPGVSLFCLYDNRLVLSDRREDPIGEAPPMPENAVAAGPFQCNNGEVLLVQGTAFNLDSEDWYVIYVTTPGDRSRLRACELGKFLANFRQPNPMRQLTHP